MSMLSIAREKMIESLKSGDKVDKGIYSNIVNALTLKEKDNKSALTTEQEVEVVTKLVKQIKESIETCPSDRADKLKEFNHELELISQFMPKQMDEDEIAEVIEGVLSDLGIQAYTPKDKGKVMKVLMPLVKGKADGKLVNNILSRYIAE